MAIPRSTSGISCSKGGSSQAPPWTRLYSVIAYTVSRQTHEIGIRVALGASRLDVFRLVAAMGLRLLANGLVVGVGLSLAATRLIATQLWTVSQYDPVTLTTVVLMLGLVGVAACYVPARRAQRVSPIVALRYE